MESLRGQLASRVKAVEHTAEARTNMSVHLAHACKRLIGVTEDINAFAAQQKLQVAIFTRQSGKALDAASEAWAATATQLFALAEACVLGYDHRVAGIEDVLRWVFRPLHGQDGCLRGAVETSCWPGAVQQGTMSLLTTEFFVGTPVITLDDFDGPGLQGIIPGSSGGALRRNKLHFTANFSPWQWTKDVVITASVAGTLTCVTTTPDNKTCVNVFVDQLDAEEALVDIEVFGQRLGEAIPPTIRLQVCGLMNLVVSTPYLPCIYLQRGVRVLD